MHIPALLSTEISTQSAVKGSILIVDQWQKFVAVIVTDIGHMSLHPHNTSVQLATHQNLKLIYWVDIVELKTATDRMSLHESQSIQCLIPLD